MADEEPDYKVYRSRPRRCRERRRGPTSAEPAELRAPDEPPPDYEVHAAAAPRLPRLPTPPPPRRGRPARRAASPPAASLKWVVLALVAWVGLSAVLFMVSAQIQRGDLATRSAPSSIPARSR